MKIIITGTHFTTALAVIEEFKKYQEVEIIYVGRKTTMEGETSKSVESEIVPKYGIKFIPIIAGRLQKSFTLYTIPSLLKLPIGFIQAFFIILKEKPNVILSFGGYVSVPVVIAGWLFSIPIIIHGQTLVTGLATKLGSWFADKVAVSFKESGLYKSGEVILTGNPIRKEIREKSLCVNVKHLPGVIKKVQKQGLPVVLVTGGNQGSHVINLAIEGCLERLLKVSCVIHQTGDSKFKDFERLKNLENDKYKVYKWIDNMGDILRSVDLVIGRAGINILSELAYLGKPALVIPIPYLYQDEQQKNAKFFEKLGLVRILLQSKLSEKSLLENIKSMIKNLDKLNRGAKKAKEVIIPDASKRVALETILLGKRQI